MLHFVAALVVLAVAAAAACGGGEVDQPPVLTVRNETDCIIHVRFDNGPAAGRVQPHTSAEFRDDRIDEYDWVKVESTQAIFRTYALDDVRADGYTLTVGPSVADKPCVER